MCGVKGHFIVLFKLHSARRFLKMSVWSLACQQSAFSAISQWKTFIRVLPTRWRRKPAGIEITSLTPYVYVHVYCYLFWFIFCTASYCCVSQLDAHVRLLCAIKFYFVTYLICFYHCLCVHVSHLIISCCFVLSLFLLVLYNHPVKCHCPVCIMLSP